MCVSGVCIQQAPFRCLQLWLFLPYVNSYGVNASERKLQQTSCASLSWSVLQSLKKEVNEREPEVNRINDEVKGMLNKAPSGSLQELARSLMKMNSLWGDVTQRIDRYTTLYDTSEAQWREFKGMIIYNNFIEDL